MKIWTSEDTFVSKHAIRYMVAQAVQEELGEEGTSYSLAFYLERFCDPLGNPGFKEWRKNRFRIIFEGEVISPWVAKKLKNIGFNNIIVDYPNKDEVIEAFVTKQKH